MKEKLKKEYLKEHKKEACIYIAVIVVVIGLLCYYYFDQQNKEAELLTQSQTEETQETAETENTYQEEVYVDICGAVNEEKVVSLPGGSRIEDAIEEAGGLKKDADLTNINRAQVLEDGQKIYIPFEGEEESTESSSSNSSENTSGIDNDGLVNLNTATAEELETLDGVGPVTAEKIIAWRDEYGNFEKTEDLMEVNGIGEKTYAQLKDKIKV